MMDSKFRLVSCGDSVIVWDGYDPVLSYNPVSGSKKVLNSSWSNDGSCIASSIDGSDKICLSYLKSSRNTSVEVSTTLGCNPIRVQYPRTSSNHLIVGARSKVFFYDVAKQKHRKEFKLPSGLALSCIASNFNDTYIAVGGNNGQISLLSFVTGHVGTPLKNVRLQDVTSVKYSNIKHSTLATAGEAGHVAIWDCNANKQLHLFSEHKAPATGVAFSPVNEALFLSAGLDKRCVCYDIQTKIIASSFRCEQPLTSVDFAPDGLTLALGTVNGKVLIYDLRSYKTPIKVMAGHSGSVKCVQYEPPISDRPSFGSLSKSSSLSKLTSQQSKKNLKENLPSIPENGGQNSINDPASLMMNFTGSPLVTSGTVNRRESLSSQIFSPIRDVCDFSPAQTDPLSAEKRNSILSNSRLSCGSVFSPLRENSFNGANVSLTRTPTSTYNENYTGTTSISNPVLIQPDEFSSSWLSKKFETDFKQGDTQIQQDQTHQVQKNVQNVTPVPESIRDKLPSVQQEVQSINNLQMGVQGDQSLLQKNSVTSENLVEAQRQENVQHSRPMSTHPGILPLPAIPSIGSQFELQDFTAPKEVTDARDSKKQKMTETVKDMPPSELNNVMTAFPEAFFDTMDFARVGENNLFSNQVEKQIRGEDFNEGQQFREDYYRGVVRDEMDDFCTEIRKHLWQLQWDQIRNFDSQRTEVDNMFKHYIGNIQNLVEENERLRQEIEYLKQSPFLLNSMDD